MRFEAVFLDRDGVLNVELGDYVTRPEELTLIAGAAAAVKRLNEAGLPVIVVTNQAGIGRGRYTVEGLTAVHTKLISELAAAGAKLDLVLHCPHHPDDGCDCRKPSPGMLRQAATALAFDPAKAVLVGDTARDLQAARAVGAATVLVRTGKGARVAGELPADETPDLIADDLAAAVDWILA